MEQADIVKPQGEWNRKEKLNFLRVQKILSALGVFLSIILATNLFLINAQNSNTITYWYGIISALLGVFSVVTLLWSIKQSTIIEQSQDSFAAETDNNFSRAVLIIQIILLQFFALYYLLFNFAQDDLLDSFPDSKAKSLQFENYKATIASKQTWIDLLSVIALAISAYTLFTASSLANSTSTHRIAVYVFGLILLVVTYDELQQVRAVSDAFNGLGVGLQQWAQLALRYRGILSLVFLAGIYLANARRNRLAYLITGIFFLVVIGVTLGSTGQVFRDYRTVQNHFNDNCVLELGTLSAQVVDATSCGSKYIKRTDLKPEGVCPADTTTNPSLCYQGVGSCPASNLQQIWESSIVSDPRKTEYLACVDQRCCGDVSNYYSRFLLLQAAYAFAFVYYAFVLGSFSFQLSSKDKGDNLPRGKQYFFFGAFIVLFLVFVILLFLPYSGQVPKNTNNLSTSATALIEETVAERQSKFLEFQKFEQSLSQRQESYGQEGCTQFKSFFNDFAFSKLQQFKADGSADANVAKGKTDFNRLLNFDQLVLPEDNFCKTETDCGKDAGFIYLLQLSQDKAKAAVDFQFWSREKSDRYRIIDSESARELIQPTPAANTVNRYFGVIGYSDQIDNILQGESKSLFVCNTADAASATLNVRILKVNVRNFLNPTTAATGSKGRILKMHKTHFADNTTTTTNSSSTNSSTTQTKATPLPTGDKIKFQPIVVSVFNLQNSQSINNAKVSVWVHKTEEPAEGANFLNTCDATKLTSQTSFQAVTGSNGQAEFLFHYGADVQATAAQKWSIYVYAEVPGNAFTVNCRRFSIPTLQGLQTVGFFDISLGRGLQSASSTRVVLEWDKLLIPQAEWETKSNLNLFVTFQPEEGSAETFNCHVGFTQTQCRNVQFNHRPDGFSSQSIDLKTIGAYNYLVYVQRFPNATSGNNVFDWFVSDAQASKATLKYFASASSRPLQVTELFPASRGITKTNLNVTSTQAASLQWCIRGKTTTKVTPINKDLLSATPFGIWGSTQWTDATNSFPNSNTGFKKADGTVVTAC